MKRLAYMVGLLLVLLAALLPKVVEAADFDAAVAVKFQYNFGEPLQKSELRMGLFLEERDHAELDGMGLAELRVTPARGIHYAVLDKEVQQGLAVWSQRQYASLKSALRLQDLKAIVKDFQESDQ